MPTRLMISPPAAGKTEYCIEQIRSVLKEYPLSQVRVVLPDRLQASYFRRRLSQSGGALGAYVGTFSDLYRLILERAGNYVPVASNALLHRVLQEAVDSVDLVHYAPLRTMPGFLQVLRDSFAELKRTLIYPEEFIEHAKHAPPARQELAQLYAAYQARLKTLGWADWEGLSWLAVAALEADPALMDGAIQLLAVDGFDSFIPTQLRILKLLADQGQVLVTLEGEADSLRPAHRRFMRTLGVLRQELSPELTSTSRQPSLPPDVLHIEEYVFESGAGKVKEPDHTFMLALRSPADEARESLRWIKALVVRNEIPLAECAIFIPNPDVYRPVLLSAAREFGIPVHFTRGEPLTLSPAIAALTGLLALPVQNFRTGSLFKTLRSPYFFFSFDDQTIDLLEKVSRMTLILEGRAQWNEAWERLIPVKAQAQPDLDDERTLVDLPRGAEAHALREKLDPFFTRLTPPDRAQTQTEWVRWLDDLLDENKFYENADSGRDEPACEAFRDALRAQVVSESVAGARTVDFARFISDLQSTLEGAALSDPEVKGGSLMVGTMPEVRGLRYQAVVLLGFSEGIFPAVERPDPFLTEDLRAALGLESRLERDQASLFYQAVTRADARLLITRPYLSDDGENWEPSPFWNAVEQLFSKEAIKKLRPDDPRQLADAASSQEVLFQSVRRQEPPKAYTALDDRWQDLQHAGHVMRARRARQAQGKYEGGVPDLKDALAVRYAPDKVWSASRLESYAACPQMFYVSKALGLEAVELPALGLDVRQVGSILHKILEETYKNAEDPADVESVLKQLSKEAKKIFASAPQVYGFRPSELWELEQGQFLNMLEVTIEELAVVSAGWTPFAFEQKFGFKDAPPLEIQLNDEKIRLHGVIDRIDKNEDGGLRVIDYKTGSGHLDKKELVAGNRLQLPIYALAARDALQLGEPVDGLYWAINAAKAGALKLEGFAAEHGTGVEGAIETVKAHLGNIVTGIRAGMFSPAAPKGGCPDYCPAVLWCWRYEKGGW